MTPILPLIHAGPDNRVRRWFYMSTKAQPSGFLLHLACPVWRDEALACWKLGSEIWPSIVQIRGAIPAEVDQHWQRLVQPA